MSDMSLEELDVMIDELIDADGFEEDLPETIEFAEIVPNVDIAPKDDRIRHSANARIARTKAKEVKALKIARADRDAKKVLEAKNAIKAKKELAKPDGEFVEAVE